MQALAKEIKAQGLCDGMDAMEVYTRLDRARKIRERDFVSITVNHELEDVVEIFSRLNGRGTRVTEADIYLGIVAAHAPGWVRDEFLPFLRDLREYGFDLNPNLLFRSLTAIAAGKTRFKEIPEDIWKEATIRPAWKKCQVAWQNLVKRLAEFGVLSNEPMPTQAALVTLIALQQKFPEESDFGSSFCWFLQASRYGRYSGSGTSLDEDLREVTESSSLTAAVAKLLSRIENIRPFAIDDFMQDYTDFRFGRFLLYLLAYRNQARDWDKQGHRLGFEGSKALSDFRPQWHHILPKKHLENKVEEELVDALANIAVIGPTINIRISAKDPLTYLERYEITDEKLVQQFIPVDRELFKIENYSEFLKERARGLAAKANDFIMFLSRKLPPGFAPVDK